MIGHCILSARLVHIDLPTSHHLSYQFVFFHKSVIVSNYASHLQMFVKQFQLCVLNCDTNDKFCLLELHCLVYCGKSFKSILFSIFRHLLDLFAICVAPGL